MVSDQFQVLHRNHLVYEKNNNKDYLDLITAKVNKQDKFVSTPTFLRDGIETDEIYIKEIIVWVVFGSIQIDSLSEEIFAELGSALNYPFFKLEDQQIEDMERFVNSDWVTSATKYRNLQFLLHMLKLFGPHKTLLFITDFMVQAP
jgi:signal peptidase I